MFCMRSIVGRGYVQGFGSVILVSEIPILLDIRSNPEGKNLGRQYLVGSFSGALSSQKVTEESIKVS
jgi:hypothetical protein